MRLVMTIAMMVIYSASAAADSYTDIYKAYNHDQEKTEDHLDTMKVCFINAKPYSAGMIAVIKGRSFKCLRGLNSFGVRSSSRKLEWVEEVKDK